MVNIKQSVKRLFVGIAVTVIVLIVTLLLIISPLAKYFIEKYDDVILGRKIRIGWIYVNPVTGYELNFHF